MLMSVAANGSRLAYVSYLKVGHPEIRLMDVGTRRLAAVPLSSDNRSPFLRLSADGSRLAYRDLLNGNPVSYSVPAINPAPNAPLCERCSLVGYFSRSNDVLAAYGPLLVRQNVSTGVRMPLIEVATADPALSPDDRWLAFVAAKPDGSAGLFVVPMRDQPVPPLEWISVAEDRNFIGSPQWSPQGRLLYYISNRDSFSCVWAQAFDAARKTFGKPIHVYHDRAFPSLKASPGRSIAVTPDRLYLMMATTESNIWTMKIDRP
jgi:Tol biopolymer transport system component